VVMADKRALGQVAPVQIHIRDGTTGAQVPPGLRLVGEQGGVVVTQVAGMYEDAPFDHHVTCKRVSNIDMLHHSMYA